MYSTAKYSKQREQRWFSSVVTAAFQMNCLSDIVQYLPCQCPSGTDRASLLPWTDLFVGYHCVIAKLHGCKFVWAQLLYIVLQNLWDIYWHLLNHSQYTDFSECVWGSSGKHVWRQIFMQPNAQRHAFDRLIVVYIMLWSFQEPFAVWTASLPSRVDTRTDTTSYHTSPSSGSLHDCWTPPEDYYCFI